MSETIKLIIEIPKEDIELICKTSFVEDERTMFKQSPSDRQGTMMLFRVMDSVKNGTPLEDIKSEIYKAYEDITMYSCDEQVSCFASRVCEILNSIGKAESEDT